MIPVYSVTIEQARTPVGLQYVYVLILDGASGRRWRSERLFVGYHARGEARVHAARVRHALKQGANPRHSTKWRELASAREERAA